MGNNTRALETFVRELLDPAAGWGRRQEFHDNPFTCTQHLSSWERALLFTMDRDFIISNTHGLTTIIESYQMASDWPAQGEDWPADPTQLQSFLAALSWQPAPTPPAATPGTVPFGALSQGTAGPGGWTDPGPHGRGFKPTSAALGEKKVELVLVGEGYLDTAEVVFRNNDLGFTKTVPLKEVAVANFRRVYLRTQPFDVVRGEGWKAGKTYQVLVRNEASLDYWLDAGLLFGIT